MLYIIYCKTYKMACLLFCLQIDEILKKDVTEKFSKLKWTLKVRSCLSFRFFILFLNVLGTAWTPCTTHEIKN